MKKGTLLILLILGIVGGTAAKGAALTPSEAQAVSAAAAAATAQP